MFTYAQQHSHSTSLTMDNPINNADSWSTTKFVRTSESWHSNVVIYLTITLFKIAFGLDFGFHKWTLGFTRIQTRVFFKDFCLWGRRCWEYCWHNFTRLIFEHYISLDLRMTIRFWLLGSIVWWESGWNIENLANFNQKWLTLFSEVEFGQFWHLNKFTRFMNDRQILANGFYG